MPELWVPGAAGPSVEDLIQSILKTIERFSGEQGWKQATVEVELHDGALFRLAGISPEPGFGFVTLLPHPEPGEKPQAVIVAIGSITRLRIAAPEERAHFGFVPPDVSA